MALTSTLFTGLSGLDANTTRLNVVGNNIANANTVAFKASRALFKPQFYVTDSGGSAPSATFGGVNPSQRGLGTEVASIQKDFTPGSIETTGKSTDHGDHSDNRDRVHIVVPFAFEEGREHVLSAMGHAVHEGHQQHQIEKSPPIPCNRSAVRLPVSSVFVPCPRFLHLSPDE